jgi:hypothetical protein
MKLQLTFMKMYSMSLTFFLPEIIHVYFFNIKELESGEIVAGGREEISNGLSQQAHVFLIDNHSPVFCMREKIAVKRLCLQRCLVFRLTFFP